MSLPLFAKINDKITMIHLSDSDSNIYLVGDTIIDTGTGLNFVRMNDVLRRLQKTPDDIKMVVNTHAHYDHIGGNAFFEKAEIAIHVEEADVIEKADKEKSVADFFGGNLHPMEVKNKLKEGDEIEGMVVVHTPGHSPGSICLFDKESGILISGDMVFMEGIGRTDLPGGSEDQLVESMEKILSLEPKMILPGHGEPIKTNPAKKVIIVFLFFIFLPHRF